MNDQSVGELFEGGNNSPYDSLRFTIVYNGTEKKFYWIKTLFEQYKKHFLIILLNQNLFYFSDFKVSPQKSISTQVRANELKFGGYVGAEVKSL